MSATEIPVQPDQRAATSSLTKTFVIIGVAAGLSAALAFTVVRALATRRPVDPTSARIQQLIDEANHLLRTLDDQRNAG